MIMITDDEQEPLLGDGRRPTRESNDGRKKLETKPGVDVITLIVLILGSFWALGCESFVISTHDDIASFFNQLSLGPWLLTAYNMGYCMMLPVYGSLAEMYGTKRMLLLAYGIFGVGTIVTGCALSMPMAIIGRFITSTGGAGMTDLVSVLINDLAPIEQVPVLRSYVSLGMGLGLSCGAPLGGILTDTVGWRWSFLCQAPGALFCVLVSAKQIPSDDSPSTRHDSLEEGESRWRKLDFLGFSFLVVFISCLLCVLQAVGESEKQDRTLIASLTAACAVSGVAFLLVEFRTNKVPLVPFRLMKNGIGKIWLGQSFLSFAHFGLITNVSSYLIYTRNSSSSVAGIPMVIYAVGATCSALITGRLIRRFKRCNILSAFGTCFMSVASVLILVRWRWDPYWWEIGYILIHGLGTHNLYSSQFMALSVRVPEKSASVITTYYLCQQIGAIFGSAGYNALFRTLFQSRMAENLVNFPNAQKIIPKVLQNNRFAFSLPENILAKVQMSFLESFQIIPILSLSSSVMLLLVILCLEDIPLAE